MTSKLKVYELAKELGQDSQNVVDVVQRLGIDIKNSMSVLGSEEVKTVREYYRKQLKLTGKPPGGSTKSSVTEKRVGATVIRRRAKATDKGGEAEAVAEPAVETPVATAAEEMFEDAPVAIEPEAVEVPENEEAVVEAVSEEETVEGSMEPPRVESRKAPEAPPPVLAEPETPREGKVAVKPMPKAVPVPPPKPRRSYPSIIKKVATEQYLGETVGPKVEKRERPVREQTPAARPQPGQRPKPGQAPGQTAATTTTPGVAGLPGRKGVREIDLATATDAAKEATKRRMAQRQDTVFKSADYLKRELVHATKKRKTVVNRPAMKTLLTTRAEHKRVIEMGETIQVSELAHQLGQKAAAVVGKLFAMGVTATINQNVDFDTASLLAQEFGWEAKQSLLFKEEEFIPAVDLSEGVLKSRPPVVTIMGHVDHGKTSLLDAIRRTKVAAGEAGGITQHIGAYTVNMPKGKITFIDTPGHEAFTSMRARGAKVTDIVVLVVSAADGVMPQTLESIQHAKAGSVPIIVAINKVDLPDANPEKIKQTLVGHGLTPEEWGGETIFVPVSAKTGQNLDKLLESILLQAELLELKANYTAPARGTVIEAKLDKNRGPVATVLVQHGVLKVGDVLVCGPAFGKVRAMSDALGKRVEEAGPSEPVEVLGLSEVPASGDDVFVVSDDKDARDIADSRADKARQKATEKPKLTLEQMLSATVDGDKELRVVLKADVQGSAEALKDALARFPQERVKLKMLLVGTGGITESDVMLASASNAVILGFNIRPDVKAQKIAEAEKVEIKTYSIIYDLLEDVKMLLEGLLDRIVKEKVIGRAEVRTIFHVPKVGTVAGSAVIDGKVTRNCFVRVLRDSRVLYEGKLGSLRRFKDDVKEVVSGYECGISVENFNDLKLGDQFEAFVKEETKDTL